MNRLRGLSRVGRLVLALAIGGAVFGIASAVQASIPDASGVIHGCYKTNGGALRLIDTGASGACIPSEAPITWSQTGPKGSTGAKGTTGSRGPTGARGPTGSAGTNGTNGTNGARGATGPTGARGPTGSAGTNGTNGTNGQKGATGAKGPTGPAGGLDTTQIISQPVDVPPHVVSPAVHQDAICPTGMIAVSGGYFIANLDPNNPPGALISWRPNTQPDRWQVFFYNPSNNGTIVSAQTIAYCAHNG